MIKDVKSLKEHLNNGKIYPHDILHILTVVRNEIHDRNLQAQFKYLNLFCNWAVHSKITSSVIVLDIIIAYVESLLNWDLGKHDEIEKFNDEIIDGLRTEWIKLFDIVDINSDFLKDISVFEYILPYILSILYDRPLIIPNDKFLEARPSRTEKSKKLALLTEKLYKKECKIESLKLVKDKDKLLLWNLTSSIYIDIQIPIGYNKRRISLKKV